MTRPKRPELKQEIIGRPERYGWNECHKAHDEYVKYLEDRAVLEPLDEEKVKQCLLDCLMEGGKYIDDATKAICERFGR